jgi:hypothetical protein
VPPSTRRRRLLLALLAALGMAALGLASYELYLRRTESHVVAQRRAGLAAGLLESDPEMLVRFTPRGKRLVPGARVVIRNHHLSGRDVPVAINSLGLRDDELPRDKAPDELRVLVLGDSITWGDYLPAGEVYVEQAQQRLRRLLPGRRVQVINAGIGDSGLHEELDLLQEVGPTLAPDVVVLAFYLNDSRPPWGFPGEVGSRGWLRRHSLVADKVYRKLRYWRWVKRKGQKRFRWHEQAQRLDWRRSREQFLKLAGLANYDWGAAWEEDSWPPVERGLSRLRDRGRERGFAVALVAFPVAFQVHADFVEDAPQRRLRALARRLGFAYLDLLPGLRRQRGRRLFYDHCHPLPATNAWIGQQLSDLLLPLLQRRGSSRHQR